MEYCEQCGYIKQQCQCEKPMTNADRIRNMSDSELARYLMCMQIGTKANNRVDSQNDLLEWLQAEVKGEE